MKARMQMGWMADSGALSRGMRALALASLVLGLGLAPVACRRATPAVDVDEASRSDDPGGAPVVGGRPELPLRQAGLASLPLFPEVDAPLTLVRSEPEDGAEGVSPVAETTRIVLRFNHPVVPLVTVAEMVDLPTPATIEPALEGEGEWLDTSTWVFQPAEDLLPSSEYAVRVDPDLVDALGSKLEAPAGFSFTTALPSVLSTYPEMRAQDAGAANTISVTFSQAMDRKSAEASFDLRASDAEGPVRGAFRWAGNEMAFLPREALERGVEYRGRVLAGARSAVGDAEILEDYDWTFRTAPWPRLASSLPGDGDEGSAQLRDSLTLDFNTPMDEEALRVTIEPTITGQAMWFSDDSSTAHVYGGWQASTAYTVTVEADSRARSGDALRDPAVIRFSSAPLPPSLRLRTTGHFGLYDALEPILVYADATNVEQATIDLYSVPARTFLRLALSERWDAVREYRPSEDSLLRSWDLETRAPVDVRRRVSTTLSLPGAAVLSPAVYCVRATGPDGRVSSDGWEQSLLLVSDIHLAMKHGANEVVVWATDLRTGAPVAGVQIALHENPDAALATGTTDQDGIFRAEGLRFGEAYVTLVALAEADGEVIAAVSSRWQEGIEPYAFNIAYDGYPRRHYANLYTDRPLYRAGQTVHFRGVLREDDDATYSLPDVRGLRLNLRDPEYEQVFSEELQLSEYGTFNHSHALETAAMLGTYQASVEVREQAGDWLEVTSVPFRAAAYRKPEFEVEVTTNQPEYRQGETIEVSVDARYFFGGSVADAELNWRLFSDDLFFRPPDIEGRWQFVDYDLIEARYGDAQGEVVAEGDGSTDEAGRFTFELPADVSEYPLSQAFTIEAELGDLNRQVVASRASVAVHKSGLYVGLRPRNYVEEAGAPIEFDVLTVDPQGRPLPDRPIELRLESRVWNSVREKREDGSYYWTHSYSDTLVAQTRLTSDEAGEALGELVAKKGGTHRIVAVARDEAGNEARSAAYVWVLGREYVNWRPENNDRIELVADQDLYRPGDVARVLVPAPFAGAEALVTLERGHILESRHVVLETNSEVLEIPIGPEHVPNVYVSVLMVKGVGPDSPLPQYRLAYTNLAVSDEQKRLDIEVSTDKEGPYGPGETVRYDLRVRDHAGEPVRAELSLALVDKALLALADDGSTGLAEAFYGQRMLGVSTAAGLTESVRRLNQELAAEKKGGGGGMAEAAGTVRRTFRDTAYWDAALETDADGRASASVSLPDNLTTWNLRLKGVTGADTLVGDRSHEILSTKPLLLQPVVPRFLVVSDTLQVEAVIQNRSEVDRAVEVSLSGLGIELLSDAEREAEVPAGGKRSVVWAVRVPAEGLGGARLPDAFGQASLRMEATSEALSDIVELALPVYAFNEAQTVTTAGQVDGKVTEKIRLPERIDAGQGGLTVEVNPSLAAAAIDSLQAFERDPWDCTSSSVDKLLANASTLLTLQRLAEIEGREGLRGRLALESKGLVQRLRNFQNADGGWGYCPPSDSDPWISAYALLALTLAERAEVPMDPSGVERSIDYLKGYLNGPVDAEEGWDLDQRAFIVWALAERDATPMGRILPLYTRRAGMSTFGRAFVMLAMARAGEPEDARVKGLLADLSAEAIVSATGAHWEELKRNPWALSTDTRTTAIGILALSRLDPESSVLDGAVRWLMTERSQQQWETLQETAWAVLGLGEFMQASGELEADYSYNVALNEAELAKGRVDSTNLDEVVTMQAAARDLKEEGDNDLVIRRDGPGQLYYTAELRVYQPVDAFLPMSRGIVVGRQYFAVDATTFEPTGEPIDRALIGDVIQVRITVLTEEPRYHVELSDPIPAGFEIIDTSLKTASAAAAGPAFEESRSEAEGPLPWWQRPWWGAWGRSQLLDERALLQSERLDPGTYTYTYLLRASVAGQYHVMPAHAQERFFPEVFGRSAGGLFTVEAPKEQGD